MLFCCTDTSHKTQPREQSRGASSENYQLWKIYHLWRKLTTHWKRECKKSKVFSGTICGLLRAIPKRSHRSNTPCLWFLTEGPSTRRRNDLEFRGFYDSYEYASFTFSSRSIRPRNANMIPKNLESIHCLLSNVVDFQRPPEPLVTTKAYSQERGRPKWLHIHSGTDIYHYLTRRIWKYGEYEDKQCFF